MVEATGMLAGVHPDLIRVLEQAVSAGVKFVVVQGARTLAEEAKLVAKHLSRTMNSRHLPGADGFAHAVDLAAVAPNGAIDWADGREATVYGALAAEIKAAAAAIGVPLEWGGDWVRWQDWDHFQLPEAKYP